MPINIQPSDGLLKPAMDMGFGLELRKTGSKQQSSSKTARESFVLPQSNRSPKDAAGKLKSKSGVVPQRSDLKQKAKQDAETVKRSANESDELVKHMSNLPGYLLHTDRVENFQEKAFNVGVLDWSRLEKWKHKHIPVLSSSFTSYNSRESSSSSSRTAAKSSSTSVGGREKIADKKGLLSSGMRLPTNRESLPESIKLPFQNVKRFESLRSVTRSIGDEQRMTPREFESFGKTRSDVSLEKERRNDYSKRPPHVRNLASNSKHHAVSSVPNEDANGRDDGAKQKMEGLQEYNNHKINERNHKSSSDMGQPSAKSKNKGASFSPKKMSSGSSETRKKVDQLQESDFGNRKHCHGKPSNIVLLYPHEIPHSSSSDEFRQSEFRTSSDENFPESSRSSLSYVSIPDEVYTEDGCPEIPLPSALCSVVEHTSCSETMQHRIGTDLGIDDSSVVSEPPASMINKMSGLHSGAACFEKDVLDNKMRNECAFSNLMESLDQETAELTAQKGMNPSHNRRFSFSLSRISRSFSFKEGPTIPQISSRHASARSGPVTPGSSVRWDNSSKEKAATSQNRTKSSPLRRLLDPILKHKASDTHHSAESSLTRKESMNSTSFRSVGVNEPLQAEKSKGSSIQGLLQLTVRNGMPLFKFVLNNERKIYAATRNSLASLEKDDIGCLFTFYLVNEIKKKSGGWMSHGHKEKNCGYAYNVVAQMKSSNSKITEPINQNSKRRRMVKEYVLVGVEIGQTDQGPPKFIQSKELAAVVIETPRENLSNEGPRSDHNNLLKKGCLKCSAGERCLCSSGENDIPDSTTVILPGGVHGSPNKGEPSPLIYRWKTGGSCDCGGWDIGCKLLVLCEHKFSSNVPRSYKLHHDPFQLFNQEGAEQDTPLFTLLHLKNGFYSVEFSSTITHLQAFFISVTALSCQKLPGSLEMGGSMHEESLKNNSRHQGKAPVKYAPIPPLSPVGRV